jgi:hypothetical protein
VPPAFFKNQVEWQLVLSRFVPVMSKVSPGCAGGELSYPVTVGAPGAGVAVGGAGVAVAGMGVNVGGAGVSVEVGGAGVKVAVGGPGVAVGGAGVNVLVGGAGVNVAVGGPGVFVARGVLVGGTGVLVGLGLTTESLWQLLPTEKTTARNNPMSFKDFRNMTSLPSTFRSSLPLRS